MIQKDLKCNIYVFYLLDKFLIALVQRFDKVSQANLDKDLGTRSLYNPHRASPDIEYFKLLITKNVVSVCSGILIRKENHLNYNTNYLNCTN